MALSRLPSVPQAALRRSLGLAGRVRLTLGFGHIPLATLQRRYEKPASRYLVIDGTRVHYTDEGEGPALVLLHGVMASLHTWDGWVDALAGHFRIIRVDLPGFGLTGPLASGEYTPEYALTFIEQFRRQLGLERFHLAGNSLGGFLSWFYAVHHPECVERLVLLDPIAYSQPLPPLIALVSAPGMHVISRHVAPRPLVRRGIREVYGDLARMRPGTDSRYADLLMRPGNKAGMVAYFRLLADMNRDNRFAARVRELRVPTLLLWGARDRWVPPALVRRWQQDVPGLTVKVYPDAGHIPMEEIPEASAQDALDFLLMREAKVAAA